MKRLQRASIRGLFVRKNTVWGVDAIMAKRVLVVEDEPNIAESLSFLLGRAGFAVEVIGDGHSALDALLAAPPDVLVLDVMLPGLDGYSILRALRADDRTAALPVLVLTAKGQREDRQTAEEAGASRFVTKPFSNADIVSAVQEMAG